MEFYHHIFSVFLAIRFYNKGASIGNDAFIDDLLDLFRIFRSLRYMFQNHVMRYLFPAVDFFFFPAKQTGAVKRFRELYSYAAVLEIGVLAAFEIFLAV